MSIDQYTIICIRVMNHVWLAVLHGKWKTLTFDITCKLFNQIFVIFAMLIGTDTKDEIYDPVASSL